MGDIEVFGGAQHPHPSIEVFEENVRRAPHSLVVVETEENATKAGK